MNLRNVLLAVGAASVLAGVVLLFILVGTMGDPPAPAQRRSKAGRRSWWRPKQSKLAKRCRKKISLLKKSDRERLKENFCVTKKTKF